MIDLYSQGQLEDRLLAGISKNDFTLRLLRAVGRNKQSQGGSHGTNSALSPATTLGTTVSSNVASDQDLPRETTSLSYGAITPLAQSSGTNDPSSRAAISHETRQESAPVVTPYSANTDESGNASSSVQRMLGERRERLEAEQKTREAAEKAERQERERARKQEALDAAAASQSNGIGAVSSSRLTYAQEQVQKKKQDKLARERVLKQLEMDKLERKEREARRKAAAKIEAGAVDEPSVENVLPSQSSQAAECSIQVRLLDGSTIRSRFDKHDTLALAVRHWVDEKRTDGVIPYTFKHIMTPMPNRSVSTSDEHQKLQDIALLPSATLILVPVPGYTEAYGRKDGNVLSSKLAKLYAYVIATIVTVVNTLGAFLARGATPRQTTSLPHSASTTSNEESKSTSTGSKAGPAGSAETKIRIRTLRDQEIDQNDQQLYNGNQVSPVMADL